MPTVIVKVVVSPHLWKGIICGIKSCCIGLQLVIFLRTSGIANIRRLGDAYCFFVSVSVFRGSLVIRSSFYHRGLVLLGV